MRLSPSIATTASIGAVLTGFGLTILFGSPVGWFGEFQGWPVVGSVLLLAGLCLLTAAGVLLVRMNGTTRDRRVSYRTDPTTGLKAFRNHMTTPITITGVESSEHVDHLAIGLPWTIEPGEKVDFNAKRNPSGRGQSVITWEDSRGRPHRFRIMVTESGPIFPGLQIF